MACSKYNEDSADMSFFKFRDVICCVECKSIEVKEMVMLKCMHFVCSKKEVNEVLTCLEKLLTVPKTSEPEEAQSAEHSSETSPKMFQCCDSLCKMISDFKDIEKSKAYTQEVLKFSREITTAWEDGRKIEIKCEACGEERVSKHHLKQGFPGMRVCTDCDPKAFVCVKCTSSSRHHDLQRSKKMHDDFKEYEYERDEWDALYNTLRTFPQNLPTSSPVGIPELQQPQDDHGIASKLKYRPHQPYTTIELLKVIDYNVKAELTFKPKLLKTLSTANACCEKTEEARNYELHKLNLRQTFFENFFLRSIIHNKILKLLIQVYPEKHKVWEAIQPQFDVLAMILNSGLPMTKIYRDNDSDSTTYMKDCAVHMIPFSKMSRFGYDNYSKDGTMYESIIEPVPEYGLSPTSNIQISVARLDSKNNFCEIDPVTQQYAYEEITKEASRGLIEAMILKETNALRCIKVAPRLYACSGHEAVEIIRISRNRTTIRERCKLSEDGETFGEGLCFEKGYLYALLVFSKTVASWEMDPESFLVNKRYISLSASPYVFVPTDSLVTEVDLGDFGFCVCFDLQHPRRDKPRTSDRKRQIIGFKAEEESRYRLIYGLGDPPILERPLFAGDQGVRIFTLIERTQKGNNLVIQSEDRTWFKVRFQVDQEPPLLVTDAFLSQKAPHCLYILYQLPDSPQVDAAAAAATPGAQTIRKIRIFLAAYVKSSYAFNLH